MTAATALVKIGDRYVQVDENVLEAINRAIVDCPVGGNYSDSPVDAKKRTRLVASLVVKNIDPKTQEVQSG